MSQLPIKTRNELEASHTSQAIKQRLTDGPKHVNLRDFIFGAIDGTVTTFAVVSGVSGAGLAVGVVIVLGLANLVGDGFSMGVGNFLGTRAFRQQRERTRREEARQVEHIPEGEKEEVRQIFAAKGFTGNDLERVVEVITSDKELWVNTMLQEEHGFSNVDASPWRAGVVTYSGFMLAGLVPLVPFLYLIVFSGTPTSPFIWSTIFTCITFFAIGAIKTRFVEQSWLWGGLETLLVGALAAGLAYLVGALLKGIVGVI